MPVGWIRATKGVRYREHTERKHGKRPDRYYALQYKRTGKVINEAVGWNSDGVTQADCEKILVQLRENWKNGSGPQTLAEMRATNLAKEADAKREKETRQRLDVCLRAYFEGEYLAAQTTKKESSITTERILFNKWILPFLSDVPLHTIDVRKVEAFQNHLKSAGKSDATTRYALAVLSQIWNTAYLHNIVSGENPVKRVRKVRSDNRRIRFLTKDEAKMLLEALLKCSKDTHDVALLSLFSGLRSGEIHGLTWGDVNFEQGHIYIRDPKNKYSRHAYLTAEVAQCLQIRYIGQCKSDIVFPTRSGGLRGGISRIFERTVKALGFNEGVTDRRQKMVFHSLRHTFASWHVMAGTPLYTVGELLGHTTLEMTKRYSHLAPESVKRAAMALQGALDEPCKATVTTFRKIN